MKRISYLLLFALLAGVCAAQDTEKIPDGYHVYKYPNGAISSEGTIKNGKPEGFWKSYYVTGIKKSEGRRKNYQLDSIWVFYDQTGDTIEKINFLYGRKNGWYYKYRKAAGVGTYIWSKELFAGDKKVGMATLFYPDGSVQQTINYNDGKKEGLSKELDKNGNIITLLEYHNDFLVSREKINRVDNKNQKQGDWIEFYPDGKKKIEMSYVDNLLNGYYKEYDTKGTITVTMLYEKGAIVKSKVEDEPDIEQRDKYDQDGKLIYSGPFRMNTPVGTHREFGKDGKVINAWIYNDNGQKLSEGIVDEAGNRNGKWKDLYADGKTMAEGQYLANNKSGLWKFYTDSGKVIQTGSYNAGRPDGNWKWFYPNGATLREEEYFQGQRDGAYVEYSPDGQVLTEGQYLDGEKNGLWKYKSGSYAEEDRKSVV